LVIISIIYSLLETRYYLIVVDLAILWINLIPKVFIIKKKLLLKVITGLLDKNCHFSWNLEKSLVLIFVEWKTQKKFWNSFQHNNSRFLEAIDYHHTKGNFCSRFQRNNSRVFFGPLITITFCLILLKYNYVCLYFLVLQSFKNIFRWTVGLFVCALLGSLRICAMPPLVSLWNVIWGMSAEIHTDDVSLPRSG